LVTKPTIGLHAQAQIKKTKDEVGQTEQDAEVLERKAQGLAVDLDKMEEEAASVGAKAAQSYVLMATGATLRAPTLFNDRV
jgi:hypothetical protein